MMYTWSTIPKQKKCQLCKKDIFVTNRQQKFCPECSIEHRKAYNKNYNIKRQQKEINKVFKESGVNL